MSPFHSRSRGGHLLPGSWYQTPLESAADLATSKMYVCEGASVFGTKFKLGVRACTGISIIGMAAFEQRLHFMLMGRAYRYIHIKTPCDVNFCNQSENKMRYTCNQVKKI